MTTGSAPSELEYVAPVFRVADLERSIAFYRDGIGFAVEFVHAGFYASLRRDGARLHLNCGTPFPRDDAAVRRAEHIDACVVVANAAACLARVEAAGILPSVPLRTMPYGTEFYVRDPDGYVLGFLEPARD